MAFFPQDFVPPHERSNKTIKDNDWMDTVERVLRRLNSFISGTGITSINADTTPAQTLTAGTNITIVDNGVGDHLISATGGTVVNYGDDDPVSGGNLLHVPNPVASVQLFVQVSASFGWILYVQTVDYTIAGSAVTIINPDYAGGALRAWYRY